MSGIAPCQVQHLALGRVELHEVLPPQVCPDPSGWHPLRQTCQFIFLPIADALLRNRIHLFTVCNTHLLKTELSGLARKRLWVSFKEIVQLEYLLIHRSNNLS